MTIQLQPFLMFEGKAEEAMTFYVSLPPSSSLTSINRYGAEGPGKEESPRIATFVLAGQPFIYLDNPVSHGFGFTAAISLSVTCGAEAEVETLNTSLSEGGQVLMPLGAYPFSPKFGWVNDRFGVSWQLSLKS